MEFTTNSQLGSHALIGFQATHRTLGNGVVTGVINKESGEYVLVKFERDGLESDFSMNIFMRKWGDYFSHSVSDLSNAFNNHYQAMNARSEKDRIVSKAQSLKWQMEREEREQKAELINDEKIRLKRTEEIAAARINPEAMRRKRADRIDLLTSQMMAKQIEDSNKICEFLETRRVPSLVHFTRIENLSGILQFGILSRAELSTSFIFNDGFRYEGYQEASCLTVSYPNWQMLYKYRCQNPDANWVILTLSTEILLKLPYLCYPTNAANAKFHGEEKVTLKSRMGLDGIAGMFHDDPAGARQQRNLPESVSQLPARSIFV